MQVGVLSIQGDVRENILAARDALDGAGSVKEVMTPDEIGQVDGLIIPGGESTMIGQLSLVNGALKKIKERADAGMPVMGICAGLILLSKGAKDRTVGKTDQPLLNLLDAQVERNSFGRQKESFETELSMEQIGIPKFNGVFIRAPSISGTGSGVETLATLHDKIVAVREGNILGTAFHPELTADSSVHAYFAGMIRDAGRTRAP